MFSFSESRRREERLILSAAREQKVQSHGTCCVSAKVMVKCCDMLKTQTVLSMFWFILTKRCLS